MNSDDNLENNMSNFKINSVKNIKYPDHDDIVYVKNNCKQKKKYIKYTDVYHPSNLKNIELKNKYIPLYLESNSINNGISSTNNYKNYNDNTLLSKTIKEPIQTFNYY